MRKERTVNYYDNEQKDQQHEHGNMERQRYQRSAIRRFTGYFQLLQRQAF